MKKLLRQSRGERKNKISQRMRDEIPRRSDIRIGPEKNELNVSR